jgi:ribosome-associated protein
MTISKRTHEITQIAAHGAIDKIAVDVVALDLSDQLVLSEVFLIVTGQNEAQVDAIADEVERKLAAAGDKPIRREHGAEWILLDYSDLVVHVQSAELRKYYMLDRLWNDCPTIELEAVKEAAVNGR